MERSGSRAEEIAEVAARVEEAALGTGIVMVGVEHKESSAACGATIGTVTLGLTVTASR